MHRGGHRRTKLLGHSRTKLRRCGGSSEWPYVAEQLLPAVMVVKSKLILIEPTPWEPLGVVSGSGSTTSAHRRRAAPFTTLTPIILENPGRLIRGLGLHEEIDFCLTTARISFFLTRAPQNYDSRTTPALLAHFPPPARTEFEGCECSGQEEYSARRKSQWHKGGGTKVPINNTQSLHFDGSK